MVSQNEQDPFTDAWERMGFLNATAGLAHLYIGFAALVERVLSG